MTKILIKNQRLATHRLLLQMIRVFSELYFLTDRYGTAASDAVLCSAIFVGQAEGRRFSASKLADYTGTPRATVIRRLTVLEGRGIVKRTARKVYFVPEDLLNRPHVLKKWAGLIKSINAVSQTLSKVDT